MDFLNLFKHLLPRAIAWNITIKKSLRSFFEALKVLPEHFKVYADQIIYLDYFSDTTTQLKEWNLEYGLNAYLLSDQEQRNRIKALRSVDRGQAALTIQNYLQRYGFDVYVYDSYSSGSSFVCGQPEAYCGNPLMQCGDEWVIKNPFDYLRPTFLPQNTYEYTCGYVDAYCGNPQMQCGVIGGESPYYPMVNKIAIDRPSYTTVCGAIDSYCGSSSAQCGSYDKIIHTYKNYTISSDPKTWAYFVYIAGDTFPNPAEVPLSRKEEFENLCLKLCPTQDWLGMIIDYI